MGKLRRIKEGVSTLSESASWWPNWKRPEALSLSLILILASCQQAPPPQVLPVTSGATTQVGSTPSTSNNTGGTATGQANKVIAKALPGVFFLPPIVKNPGQLGTLEENARLNIEIFKLDSSNESGSDIGPRFSVKAGNITKDGGHYLANWKTSDSKQADKTTLRVELRLDNAPEGQPACTNGADINAGCLAFFDAQLWRNQGDANKYGDQSGNILNLVNGQALPIKFHVNAGAINVAPKVKILTPADGYSLTSDQSLKLAGSATDFEDGDLSKTISWSIDGIGSIGTGAAVEKALPVGNYTVTATVKDNQGATSTAQIQVKVTAPVAALSITSINPTFGSTLGGTEVTLTGIGFTNATSVKFGDVPATSFKVVDDKTITAVTPASATPTDTKVTVSTDKGTSNAVTYTYRIPYRISMLARPLTASIYQYVDDRLILKLNDQIIAKAAPGNLPPGDYPPLILKDFAANDGDKLTFIIVNGWPWACGSGAITLIKPDGSSTVAYPGFIDANCNDRIGEVARYEYTLPNGPGKAVPIQAPDIDSLNISTSAVNTPTTFTWKLLNPASATLNCTFDFGDGQTQTVDPCKVEDAIQHTYTSTGSYQVKLKVADGPYVSGVLSDPKSGDSNSIQKFYTATVTNKMTATSLTPDRGPLTGGTEVAINGSGFTSTTGVNFGTLPATSFKVVDDTKITAVAPVGTAVGSVPVTVLKGAEQTTPLNYTYGVNYIITSGGTDDAMLMYLNGNLVSSTEYSWNTNQSYGNFYAKDGDTLQFVLKNRWPTACGVGQITATAPDGSTKVIFAGYQDTNCINRLGEVWRYEYTLPNGPGEELPIQAPDITTLTVTPSAISTPPTISWTLTNPASAKLTCTLDFGDGQMKTVDPCNASDSTTHTYTAAATYTVKLKVADGPYASGTPGDATSGNSNSIQKFAPVTITTPVINQPPSISNLTATPSSSQPTTTLTWAVSDPENDAVSCAVDFGDGQSQQVTTCTGSQQLTHSYVANGTYTIKVKATDAKGNSADQSTTVTVSSGSNSTPTITNLSLTPTSPIASQAATLTWTASDAENDAISCTVDFGDGQNQSVSSCTGNQTFGHTYAAAGAYTVKVTATDAKNAVSSQVLSLTVQAAPVNTAPVISNLAVNPTSPIAGQAATITWNTSDDENDAVSCTVDFGDGQTQNVQMCSGAQSLSHSYTTAGAFTVLIEASDANKLANSIITLQVKPYLGQSPVIQQLTTSTPTLIDATQVYWSILNPTNTRYSCELSVSGSPITSRISECMGISNTDITFLGTSAQTITLTITDEYGRQDTKAITVTPDPIQLTRIASDSTKGTELLQIINSSSYHPVGVNYNPSSITIVQLLNGDYYIALLESNVTTLEFNYFHDLIVIRNSDIGVWYRMGINTTNDRVALSNLITGGAADVTGYSALTDAEKTQALRPALYEPIQMLSATFKQPLGSLSVKSNFTTRNSIASMASQSNTPCSSELINYRKWWEIANLGQNFLTTGWIGISLEFGGSIAGDLGLALTGYGYASTAFTYFTLGLSAVGLSTAYASITAYRAAQACLATTGFSSSRPVIALLSPLIPSVSPLPGVGTNTQVFVKSVPDGINLYSGNLGTQSARTILIDAIPNATTTYEVLSGNTIVFNSETVDSLTQTISAVVSNRDFLP